MADAGIRRALKEGSLCGSLAFQPPDRKRFTVYSRGKTFLSEGGVQRGRLSILNRELVMDAGVFFQSNAAMLELLIGDLLAAASGADKSLPMADIYCGVGTFASFLASDGMFPVIDLVEENKTALGLARENVVGSCGSHGTRVNYYALTDTAWVESKNRNSSWGFMVLDPPREGLSGSLREYLARAGPALVAYVSCDPATLARDSRCLLEGGYTLKELTLYDFYPQTAHIESLAVFDRK